MTRIIVFASGKGGVGKTTISSNVATALHKIGKSVIILDANMSAPNLSLHLGLNENGPTLHDVLNGSVNIEDAIYQTHYGLRVIPSGLSFHNLKSNLRKKLGKSLIRLLGKVDYIIVDASAGLGAEAQLAIKSADELIIVTNPELPALTDALRAKKIAEEHRVAVLGTIINKKTGFKFDLNDHNILEFLEVPLIGIVPHDIHVRKSISERTPVVLSYPKSKSAKAIKNIVNVITGEELYIPDKSDKGFFKWVKSFLGLK